MGNTPLVNAAAMSNNVEIIRELLSNGAIINSKQKVSKDSDLEWLAGVPF